MDFLSNLSLGDIGLLIFILIVVVLYFITNKKNSTGNSKSKKQGKIVVKNSTQVEMVKKFNKTIKEYNELIEDAKRVFEDLDNKSSFTSEDEDVSINKKIKDFEYANERIGVLLGEMEDCINKTQKAKFNTSLKDIKIYSSKVLNIIMEIDSAINNSNNNIK